MHQSSARSLRTLVVQMQVCVLSKSIHTKMPTKVNYRNVNLIRVNAFRLDGKIQSLVKSDFYCEYLFLYEAIAISYYRGAHLFLAKGRSVVLLMHSMTRDIMS